MPSRSRIRAIVTVVLCALASFPANANQILDLADQSDVIVLGEATAISSGEPNAARFELRIRRTFKGGLPAGASAATTLRGLNQGLITDGRVFIPEPIPEMYGLWFLKQEPDGTFTSVPRLPWGYDFDGALVRVPKTWAPSTAFPLDATLLSAALSSHRYVKSHREWDNRQESSFVDILLRNSLEYAGRFGGKDAAFRVVDELLASGDTAERNIGLAVGLAASYDAAMVRFTSDLQSNQLGPGDLPRILTELWKYDSSTELGAARVERLLRWNRSAEVPGLDQALVGSLGHVSGPSRLPLIARFLDSPELGAVQLAVRLFYLYSVLAREDGSVATDGTGGMHPYFNDVTKSHAGNDLTEVESHAEFWRQWWAAYRDDIAARGAKTR